MSYAGICVVPVERKSLATGTVHDIHMLSYMDSLVDYVDRKGLALVYLSRSLGIVYYDTFIDYEHEIVPNLSLWQSVVAEQITRLCIQHMTPKVFLMCTNVYEYADMISKLKAKGVQIQTPILGYRPSAISKALRVL